MNFRKATDELLAGVTLEDLANALGVSIQAVRQARTDEASTAFRSPPPDWERGVRKLATVRARALERLTMTLDGKKS